MAEAPPEQKINLNIASVEELERIDGIDGERARTIVAYRGEHGRFGSWDDVEGVPGISEPLLEKLQAAATVNGGLSEAALARDDDEELERA
jgi:competence ComEA-like helix-hairpin-helix protein